MTAQECLTLAKYAFHKAPTGGDDAFYKLLEQSTLHTHKVDSQVTSMIVDTQFKVYFRDQTVPMSGIGYVASYPEYRGNGAASQLMTEILQENYKQETIFSYLAPFSYAFYGQFGYHYVFDQKHYYLNSTDFPRGKKTDLTVKRLSFDQAKADLADVHDKANNHGSLYRQDFEWSYYFEIKKQPLFAIFYQGEHPTGYVIYEFKDMTFVIHEMIFLDETAKQAIYRFVSSHAGAFDEISYTAPSDSRLEADMLEPSRAKISLLPYMMARIVNLKAFLKHFPVEEKKQFTIIDELLPENNLVFGEGEKVTLTIGEFTKYVMRDVILREYF